ncbi:hypothetical protein EN868_11620 [Mesorhizobium sp. M2D.F.Ca.ET.225.01.1.1]|uniref:hypothetical protein n=1 Tax=unclassified Mesorhizobium TaxID=325217 RepID=UPI000FD34D15|nr:MULTISPECIES: hypothetical protein [unclassified Mesorhizobium]TGP55764.1 hypothetical protein EN869_025430 [Mesorhizobium sp. M2D.F.Ca.ET.226.01.1.1]TGP68222.1 hypothetical protein EN868_11620 [Mesorhizobium sp. M2D.F.Ca.ET.225.01.1.1]
MKHLFHTDDHQHCEAVAFAYDWLRGEAKNPKSKFPLIAEMRSRFGLTLDEACSVASEVYDSRRGRQWTS